MTCEKAEEFLSAYLDDMLAPPLREEVRAHVETCAHCSELAADYRRFDLLLAAAPRVAPPAELHDRIFDSPKFAALLRSIERDAGRHGGRRTALRALPRQGDGEHGEHGEAAREGETGETATPAAGSSPARHTRRIGAPPGWVRVALQTAAVFVLLFGSALLLRQGLLYSATTSTRGPTQNLGGPAGQGIPLAAGPRVVYARAGALWSAAEYGPELAQRLTSSAVNVGQSWAVSTDGSRLAYVDVRTGDLHVVRADGQSDHTIAALGRQCGPAAASGCAATGATRIVWSPDGTQLAYVTQVGALTLVNSDGTNPRAISATGQTVIGTPLWSASALRIAYVTASAGGQQSLWAYDLVAKQQQQLTAPGDGVTIAQLAWIADPLHPALTWAATQGASISGVFTVSALGDTGPLRLTPTGSRYSAAAFLSQPNGGMWALASQTSGALATVSATGMGFAQSASAGAAVASVTWAPTGRAVAVVTVNGDLSLWTPGGTLTPVLAGVSGAVAWAPDGGHLAARTSGGVVVVTLGASGLGAVTMLAQPRGDAALLWAPDGKSLALSSGTGLTIAPADGAQVKLADTAAGGGWPLAWTVAG